MILKYKDYIQKLHGCFMGKAVGGTLGMPMEGYIGVKKITYYDPVPTQMIANDDLDLQVVWMEVIRECGLPVNRRDLADGWLRHMRILPDEYGVVMRNLKNGLYPPLSGSYDNKFGSGMGSAIRSEIWASLAPCDPPLAVKLALEDCCCDHYGDGVDATAFLTAVESAAYGESDINKLFEVGLSFVTAGSRVDTMLRDTLGWLNLTGSPDAIRERILEKYFVQNWTDVGINLSYILTGLFDGSREVSHSDKISRGLCTAVGLGHDADCTGATLGSIFGILYPEEFDEKWTKPLGESLLLSGCIAGMHEVGTINEFCLQVAEMCGEVQDYYASQTHIVGIPSSSVKCRRFAVSDRTISLYKGGNAADYNSRESLVALRPFTVKLVYPDKVSHKPSECCTYTAEISNPTGKRVNAELCLSVSDGWLVSPDKFDLDGDICIISFEITSPGLRGRRVSHNDIYFNFISDGLSFCADAGLLETYPVLHKEMEWSGEECPKLSDFKDSEILNMHEHFMSLPDGAHAFTFDVRSPHIISEAIMLAQAYRAVTVWCDGKLILSHDGSEFSPAFHRTENIARLCLTGEWMNFVVYVFADFDRSINTTPLNAYARVENCPTPYQQRLLYDRNFGFNENNEIFLGFAQRSGYEWITDLEWRIPKL